MNERLQRIRMRKRKHGLKHVADEIPWLVQVATAADRAWLELVRGDDLSPVLAKRILYEALNGEESEGEDEAQEGS